MKITDFLNVKGIKVDLEATDKESVLKEMVDLLAEVKDVGDKKNILRALIERENLGSTGIGQGIAIPHGKTDKVDGLVAVLGVSRKGVNFEALDGEPVYILFLLVAPKPVTVLSFRRAGKRCRARHALAVLISSRIPVVVVARNFIGKC